MNSKRYLLISFFVAWCGLSAFAFGEKDGQSYVSGFWTCTLKANWNTYKYDVVLSIADDYDDQTEFKDLTIPDVIDVDINDGNGDQSLQVIAIGTLGSETVGRSFTGTLTVPRIYETIGGGTTPVFQNCSIEELCFDGDVRIVENAFKDCSIDGFSINNSISVSLNAGAFEDCTFQTIDFTNADNVNIYSGAFKKCMIEEFLLTDNIESIKNAFDGDGFTKKSSTTVKNFRISDGIVNSESGKYFECYQIDCNIENLYLPDDIDKKDNIIFGFCNSTIDNVIFPDNITKIVGVDFDHNKINSMIVPDGVTEIGDDIFDWCNFTSDIDLKDVTSIGESSFQNCNFEQSITFDATGTVKHNSFNGCTFATSVNLSGVGTIGDSAFANTKFSAQVDIQTATGIGESSFENSSMPYGVVMHDVERIGDAAFRNASIRDIDFGDDLQYISDNAFAGATFTVKPTLPSTLLYIGKKAFKGANNIGSLSIPNKVETIEEEAFNECTDLASVSIPASVTFIGKHAFCSNKEDKAGVRKGNDSFKTITVAAGNSNYKVVNNVLYTKDGKTLMRVPNGAASVSIASGVTTIDDYAFHFCIDLKKSSDVTLPTTVTYIGENAFEHCINLKDFKIPANVTTIKHDAFRDCHSLTEIKVPSKVTVIEKNTFQRCNSLTGAGTQGGNMLPDGVVSIGESAFEDCHSLVEVKMPASLKTISQCAFRYCYQLTAPTFPASLESIDHAAFSHCKAITAVALPEKITRIESETFENCYSLTSLSFSKNLNHIGSGAFQYCINLPSVTIPSQVTTIEEGGFFHCYALKEVTFSKPYSITELGQGAFAYTSLTTLELPNTLTSVESCTFTHCKDLTTVKIPENITNIGTDAFSYTGITSLAFPSTLKTIQANAFRFCNNIEEVTFPETVIGVGSHAFYNCMNLKAAYCFRPEPPVYTRYEPVYDIDYANVDWTKATKTTKTGWVDGYEPPMVISGYDFDAMDYDGGNVFDQCHPHFNIFVPIENVNNYRWENFVKVELTAHTLSEGGWGDYRYYTDNTSNLGGFWVLAPMVNHKSSWTTFSYFSQLDLTGGVSGLTDKDCQVAAYAITSFDKDNLTTVAKKLDVVPEETGFLLCGSTSASDYFPLPLSPIVESASVVELPDIYNQYARAGSRNWYNDISPSGGAENAYDLSNDSNPNSKKWGTEEMPADTKGLRKLDFYTSTYTYTKHSWDWELQTLAGTDNYLRGVTEATTVCPDWGHTLFLLSGGNFYKMTTNGNFPAYKAYLDLPVTFEDAYAAKVLTISFDEGVVTGLNSLEAEKEAVWYDMRGYQLHAAPTRPGMYIRNGKKIIIK